MLTAAIPRRQFVLESLLCGFRGGLQRRDLSGQRVDRLCGGGVFLARIAADAASGAEVRAPTEQWIAGSTEQLHRVVANLVANAHRHARAQVIVTVAPTVNGRAELRVDDDGPGVPTEHRERIFERFSRLDDARARDAGGAGLGLALVRAIVERHGGQIHVETSPTLGGAAFVATFPLAG